MKKVNTVRLFGLLAFGLAAQITSAQTPLINEVSVEPSEARLEMGTEAPASFLMEISGPNNYYLKQNMTDVNDIRISPTKADGTAFEDGTYQIQITPTYRLTAQQQADLIDMRQLGDEAGIAAYRAANDLPVNASGFAINFGVRNGQFVSPEKREQGLRTPGMSQTRKDYSAPETIYASLNYFEANLNPSMTRDNSMDEEMQIFTQDVIVQGSMCVGIDCSSSESFGFDTHRLKENNLRLHFDDTSNSASFPGNDWRIAINSSENGGASYFAIEDATAGRTPFRVEAGAPNNALWIDSGGDVGIGTANPIVEVHLADGDSPTFRLEQDGSSGFTPQTWDIAGNETNFFVRDVTNGSRLPFKIKPGAPDNSLFVAANGDIGLGTQTPGQKVQVESGNVYVKNGSLGLNREPAQTLDVVGNTRVVGNVLIQGNSTFRGNNNFQMTASTTFTGAGGSRVLFLDGTNIRVGIGLTTPPAHLLELGADDAVKPNGGSWSGPSDRRLKTNVRDFEDGLSQLMAIRPVRYNYNGLLDLPTDQEFIGVIAQEMQKVAPYTIRDLNQVTPEGDQYLSYDGSAVTYILVNAVQEQQEIIDAQEARIGQLEAQVAQVAQLQQQVAALAKVLEAQASSDATVQPVVETEER